ncbi:MAG: Ig-like domain-containing protein, partial [Gammaproteobacteria bacterium]
MAPSITNLGLTWQNRFFPDGNVTTDGGGGDVHDGGWQFYASPHGGYGLPGLDCTVAGVCGDGFTITNAGAGTLYGIGGWFKGVNGPEIQFSLDGTLVSGVGGTGTDTWQFFGVIDTAGFTTAQIWDSSGTAADQNFVFADDFTIGANTVDVTPPQVQILSPANGDVLTVSSVTVSGTASDETALASVSVNGVSATLGSGTFSADVALTAGVNTLTATATDSSGNTASTSIQVTYT